MSYFKPAFLDFFKELSKNNNSAWFDQHRKTYENEVKKPFSAFVEEMISRMGKYESINIKAADAIFRINKDIRFSKEKIPYNTHVSANISAFGKKNKEFPGFYFQLNHEKIMLAGGAYMVEKENLHNIRAGILKKGTEFEKAMSGKDFKSKYGTLQGEKSKILPPEFKTSLEKQPWVANKQFYYTCELSRNIITDKKLADVLMEHYLAAKPVNDFLKSVMK